MAIAGGAAASADAPPVFANPVARVLDTELRALHPGKVDWPHMAPADRRRFLDTLNEPPRGVLG